jgi:hypothetical protein
MLLIIAYIINNERLNLGLMKNYDECFMSLNTGFKLEGDENYKMDLLVYTGGFVVNVASLSATLLIIVMNVPDPTYTEEIGRIYFTSRFISDVFLLPSTIWVLSRKLGNKDANYLKIMCGVLIGEIVTFGIGSTLTESTSFIFFVSLFTLPPLGGVIGSNL